MVWKTPEIGRSLADLVEDLGDVHPGRIPLRPPPGTATEADVIAARMKPERWLFELADGVLLLKPPSFIHSVLSGVVCSSVLTYLEREELGVGLGPSAMYRLKPGIVRIPDFSFIAWQRFVNGELPDVEIADFVPDMVVELPRPVHTRAEMDRKVNEYFEAGVRLVWLVNYPERTADVFRSANKRQHIQEDGTLIGEDVLPGFRLTLRALFDRLSRQRGLP